ncbi:NnrU family protein [gamma proteobacterium NOR5-3]|nr:NnrU family protein [gamma proteobacterium NOR5-3]
MVLLFAGIVLFTGTHLFLGLAPARANAIKQNIGDNGLKAILGVLSIAGLALLVLGWRSSEPTWLYATPAPLHGVAMALIVVALYLFVVSNRPSAVKRLIRHPQLTGVVLWAAAHLLLNGDSRSLLLFGSMLVWALLEIPIINRREGPREKPTAPGLGTELFTVVFALLFIAFLAYIHPWLAGVPAIAGLPSWP